MHKRLLLLIFLTFMLTGCVKLEHNYDNIINNTMSKSIKKDNIVSTGYKLYKPMGVRQVSDSEYNQVFNINGYNVYLYVDIVSYYYKNKLNYKNTDEYEYYYKEINNNGKVGYVGINKLDSDYFIKIVYNYCKIEFYADYNNIDPIMANSLIILNSIKYNDNLIENILGYNTSTLNEISYELETPNDNESTFLQALEEYVANEESNVELPDDE